MKRYNISAKELDFLRDMIEYLDETEVTMTESAYRQCKEVVDKIKSRLNKELKVGGVLVTQYDKRKVLNRDVLDTIKEHFKEVVFTTLIRDNIALAEAPSQGLDIFRYNSKTDLFITHGDTIVFTERVSRSIIYPLNSNLK